VPGLMDATFVVVVRGLPFLGLLAKEPPKVLKKEIPETYVYCDNAYLPTV
jgi:hypothetical protein